MSGRHRIEIEFDADTPEDAEEFATRVDEATTHFDWHVANVEVSLTPVVREAHR